MVYIRRFAPIPIEGLSAKQNFECFMLVEDNKVMVFKIH